MVSYKALNTIIEVSPAACSYRCQDVVHDSKAATGIFNPRKDFWERRTFWLETKFLAQIDRLTHVDMKLCWSVDSRYGSKRQMEGI